MKRVDPFPDRTRSCPAQTALSLLLLLLPSLASGANEDAVVHPTLSFHNRVMQLAGLPDWSRAGFRGGQDLPSSGDVTANAHCVLTPEELATYHGVVPDDGVDDTSGLQAAINTLKANCSPSANFNALSLIALPAGRIDLSRQVYVDADYLLIRGQGSGVGGTELVFRPDTNTRYDTLSTDGGRWEPLTMSWGTGGDTGKGGWIWPGRAMFRVQTRELATRYQDEHASAPANRKDLFEGSINQHWASGVKVAGKAGDAGYAAREGHRVIQLVSNANMSRFAVGGYLWVGAANSRNFYAQQQIGTAGEALMEDLHMRQQVFRIVGLDTGAKTVTIDRPLEFDVPVDSTSDGSALIGNEAFASKVTALRMVVGVGFEDFSYTQDVSGLPRLGGGTYSLAPESAVHNYGNLAPEYAMHGILFKWAADGWVRGLNAKMTGSHPLVTEVALNLQVQDNSFDGAWNKGKGGNGYLRGSRVWNSLYAFNTSRNLRHFTFQWSSSGNVAFRNNLDSDLNLHGGWERYNLFEGNLVRVPYEHRSASCTANCGGEGGQVDAGTWYPVWWATGPKAIKWAGSSGPQNVFRNNTLIKQTTQGGPYLPYTPYSTPEETLSETVFMFGSNPANPRQFLHLSQGGVPIADWTGRESLDYSQARGVATVSQPVFPSLFLLKDAPVILVSRARTGTVATWNMQGAGTGQNGPYESKYVSDLAGLLASNRGVNADVVAIQEAGIPPPSVLTAEIQRFAQNDYTNAANAQPDVVQYRLFGSQLRPQSYLYWLNTDPNGHRVNLALASQEEADEVFVVMPPINWGGPVLRPALGIRLGNTVYFSLHAISPNGPDASGLIQAIRARMAAANGGQGYDWVALGDFNRDPNSLRNALPLGQYHVLDPSGPTQGTPTPTSTLDYAVGPNHQVPRIFGGAVHGIQNSDHQPVVYSHNFRAGGGAPEEPDGPDDPELPAVAVVRSAWSGRVLDVNGNSTNHGVPIIEYPYQHGLNQQWHLRREDAHPGYYRLQNGNSHQYLGQQGSAANAILVQWHERVDDQLWRPELQPDDSYILRNFVTGQVMTSWLGGGSLHTVSGLDESPAMAFAQRWFLQSLADADDQEEIVSHPPQSGTDLVVDVEGGGILEHTPIILYPDNTSENQVFDFIKAGSLGTDPCGYLFNGTGYLSADSPVGTPQDNDVVALTYYQPQNLEILWCVSTVGSEANKLYNFTGSPKVPHKLYLTRGPVGEQLRVRTEVTSDASQLWRLRATE
ncbi:RICIN domain-containing protein [Corallococcus terminator]